MTEYKPRLDEVISYQEDLILYGKESNQELVRNYISLLETQHKQSVDSYNREKALEEREYERAENLRKEEENRKRDKRDFCTKVIMDAGKVGLFGFFTYLGYKFEKTDSFTSTVGKSMSQMASKLPFNNFFKH